MTLDPSKSPAQNFDLSHWKLTKPNGKEVSPEQLNPSPTQPRGFEKPRVFYTHPRTGGMVFRCPNLAGTTENSSYSRCELREMNHPDKPTSENFWTTGHGGTMRARLSVDRVSISGDAAKRGRVVIGQIHGPESEVVRLYYVSKRDVNHDYIMAAFDDVDNEPSWSEPIAHDVALGARFNYMIRLDGLRLVLKINDEVYAKQIDPRYRGLPLYFKAGVYNQNNTGQASDHVLATFYNLKVSHP